MKFTEAESYFETGKIEVDESYFVAKRVRGKRGRGAGDKTKVFCMKKRGDKVYMQIVNNCLFRLHQATRQLNGKFMMVL